MSLAPEASQEAEELVRSGRPRTALPLARRELAAEGLVAALFLAVAIWMGLALDAAQGWRPEHAVVLVVLFALAERAEVDVGAGYTIPVQLVFVPMLLLLPTPWVPLLVCAGWLLGKVPELVAGRVHPTRALVVPGNCWFSVGPALVLVALDAQTPDWADWPVYLLALGAQFAGEIVAGTLREWLGRGIGPSLQTLVLGWISLIDALLSPLGLLAAFASTVFEFAYLLLVPPTALFFFFALERKRRLSNALDLAATSRRLLETELAAVRSREALIAGASHEILTPLAVALGVARRLGSGAQLEPERQAAAVSTLGRELLHVRHLARQFVDYTRLKAGRSVIVRARDVDVAQLAEEVAAAYRARAAVTVRADGDAVARADPDRVEQMLMALLSNAVKYAPGSPVTIDVRSLEREIEIRVADEGPGIPEQDRPALFDELSRGGAEIEEGSGIGLFLVRALGEAQDGSVELTSPPGSGAQFTIRLPRAAPA